jgi:drug/metabolite transporter (DMT)-like permease
VTAVALGLGAAICWGLADFLGGLRARTLSLASILLFSQFAGLTAVAVVVLVSGKPAPSFADVSPALLAGAAQLVGIAALYRALALGTMSVISPISASGAAALPVIVGIAGGESPAALQFAGMAVASAGVFLATRSPDASPTQGSREALILSAVAALGFGGFFVGMDAAVDSADPFWTLLVARATAAALLIGALVALRPRLTTDPAVIPSLILIGLLDVGANACFTLGTDTGLLSVVAVLASLYPVTTVVLARGVLGERLVAIQLTGVSLALAGVALIAAG